MAEQNTFDLLGLPAEVRDRIYELALFHAESDGIIAPLRDDGSKVASWTLISGKRMQLRNRLQVVPNIMAFGNFEERKQATAQFHRTNEILAVSANFRFKHYCTTDCLLQPPLTCVSRFIREEALPVFYAVNKFHIELGNFIMHVRGHYAEASRSPTYWWRAIGDSNLRNIQRLNIFAPPRAILGPGGSMVKYTTVSGGIRTVKYSSSDPKGNEPPAWGDIPLTIRNNISDPRERRNRFECWLEMINWKDNIERCLEPYLDVLKAQGLHVRVLDSIFAEIEPETIKFLRDSDTPSPSDDKYDSPESESESEASDECPY